MFLFDWFFKSLNYLGLWKKSGKLLFLGLDNAGKTTLLYLLKTDRLIQANPTHLPQCEEMSIGNMCFTTYDLGGHIEARRVWRDYFPAVDAIVFIIDASDRSRFPASRHELHGLLSDDNISLCPILILGNKIDKRGAASEKEISEYFNINHLKIGKEKIPRENIYGRPLELFMCSLNEKQGYGEGFRWLSQYID